MLIDRFDATPLAWIHAVDTSQLPALTRCALDLRRTLDAVAPAGLNLEWSSGSIEGAVNVSKDQETALRPSQLPPTPEDDPAA